MARMHSGAKGKSGSKTPIKRVPSWAPFKEKEVEKLILKYAKLGKSASEIGMILRDSYGIHSTKALTGKKVCAILDENKAGKKLPEDLISLIKKMIAIKRHLEKNHLDEPANRGLILTQSKMMRLINYYKKSKKLPADWSLDLDRLKIYIE